jgi:hypothetical protein
VAAAIDFARAAWDLGGMLCPHLPRVIVGILMAALGLAACQSNAPDPLTVFATADTEPVLRDFVGFLPMEQAAVQVVDDPMAALAESSGAGLRIAVVADLACTDCYRAERTDAGAVVHGSAPLGVQYGLAHVLEAAGFGFYHPHRTRVPPRLRLPPADHPVFGHTYEPEMSVRGIHLHTLHPIEPYYDFWEPSEESLDGARRTLDWLVKNRGNYLQWLGLNSILQSSTAADAFEAHAKAIVETAHVRGVEVGFGVQIFGTSNLQRAFDLISQSGASLDVQRASVRARLEILAGIGFDQIQISFGEFFGEEPEKLLEAIDMTYEEIQDVMPGVTVSASVHVGDYPHMRITYGEEELLYYFLVRYANPAIVPWIHTVMYYNLFDDAGLAYLHEDFSEHREYLFDRLRAEEPVAYFPETAYWVAFDNPVPTYLPLYVLSRWLDVHTIRETALAESFGALDQHVLFSTGWDWGYWQNDWASLRMSYTIPERYEDLFVEMFAPLGDGSDAFADAVSELARLQHRHLIENRLAAWMAGRDASLDIGHGMGIYSQPHRPSYPEIAAMDAGERAGFVASVVDPLEAFATGTADVLASARASGVSVRDPWVSEVLDGIEVDEHRLRFAHAILRAVMAHAEGTSADEWLARADAELEAGRAVVARRHAALHHRDPQKLLERRQLNATLYQYGYLREADALCFWERERIQARNLIGGTTDSVPACVL